MKMFELNNSYHEVGSNNCCNVERCECGGLIHFEYLDENYDGVLHIERCDKCEI